MKGPCAKQRVICTIVAPDGRRWVGENECRNPQGACPRAGMPTGQGYELCKSVCEQIGHAEEVAATAAGRSAVGGIAYIEGHTYACAPCKAALSEIGVHDILFVGAPPCADFARRTP